MKLKSKKDYPFVVECENKEQTNAVLNHYDNNNDQWAHWKYVVIKSDSENDIYENIKYCVQVYGELSIISYSEWLQLPDYLPEEVAFENGETEVQNENLQKETLGYKLVKQEYYDAYVALRKGRYSATDFDDKYLTTEHNTSLICHLQEAGVLDLWFEPVYEGPTKEEKLKVYLTFREFNFEEQDVENIINLVNENNETK